MGRFKWSVVRAIPHDDYTIEVSFYDGKHGVYDARPLLNHAVYAPLKNLPFFLTAHAQNGTVVWNEELDIAPERLYENCK